MRFTGNKEPLLRIKKHPQDFFVEEIFEHTTEKDYTDIQWVWNWTPKKYIRIKIQKTDTNTMDIVHMLMQQYDLTRTQIWIAWLKDKYAVTIQWLSLDHHTYKRIWSLPILNRMLAEKNTCISARKRSDHPVTRSSHAANKFIIQAYPRKKLTINQYEQMEKNLQQIKTQWFTNYFGIQRFGKQWRNYKRAVAILEQFAQSWQDSYQQIFALQAYPAYRFNQLAQYRTPWTTYPWDILQETPRWTAPQGILLWDRLDLLSSNTYQWQHEAHIVQTSTYWKYQAWLQNFGIRTRRRAVWILPQKLTRKRDRQNKLTISFYLPPWSYATVLINTIQNLTL